MKQFSLEKWLQDKSRKVVTRDGREVELYYSPISRIPLIGRTSDNNIYQYTKNGFQCDIMNQAKNDLFFAEEEELSEFESKLADLLVYNHPMDIESAESIAKRKSKQLLDLARKELGLVDNTCGEYALNEAYKQGKQDALKDLPKWKRATEDKKFDKHVCVMDYYMVPFLDTEVNEGDYYIELSDLKTLPKE